MTTLVSRATPMSSDRLTRYAPLLLVVLAALLYLPRLGSNGLWDPSEVKVADAARSIVDGKPQLRFSLNAALVAKGFRVVGTGELGGRLPLALVSILLVLAAYWAGRAILRPRAALIGAVALATTPAVLFGARQLTTQAPLLLGVTLAVGGLAHLAWPLPGAGLFSRVVGLVLGLAGLALATASAGLLHGALGPLLGVAIALLATRGGRVRGAVVGVLALGVAIVAALAARKYGVYDRWLAGAPRAPQFQTVITTVLRQIGFATTPWFALVPFALYRALDDSQPAPEGDEDRARFCSVLLPAWLGAAYLMGTLHDAIVGELLAPAAPVVALLAGAYLDSLLESEDATPLEGVAIGAFVIVLGHDVLLTTEAYLSVLTTETIRWPAPLYWTSNVLFGGIALFGLTAAAALAVSLVQDGMDAAGRGWRWARSFGRPRNIDTELPPAPPPDEAHVRALGRRLTWATIGIQIVFAFALVQWFIPAASKHLSPKDLYGKTRQLDPKAALGQYRFNATGASYYMNGRTATSLNTLDDVLQFLKRGERVFIFVGGEELASIDQATRQGVHPAAPSDGVLAPPTTTYFVIDDSNSRFLILSNRLGPRRKRPQPAASPRLDHRTKAAVRADRQLRRQAKAHRLRPAARDRARRGREGAPLLPGGGASRRIVEGLLALRWSRRAREWRPRTARR